MKQILALLALATGLSVHARAAEETPWRTLPLIADGHMNTNWVHVGWGCLVVDGDSLRTDSDGKGLGLLVYAPETFGDCQIRVVYKCQDARANAGVYFRIDDGILGMVTRPGDPAERDASGRLTPAGRASMMNAATNDLGPWYAVNHGYEAQILDSADEYHRTGAIYALAPSRALPVKPPGQWRTMIITLDGTRAAIDLDGVRMSDFDSAKTNFPPMKKWSEPRREPKRPVRGYIGLQNHDPGEVVYFREVSVRPLPRTAP